VHEEPPLLWPLPNLAEFQLLLSPDAQDKAAEGSEKPPWGSILIAFADALQCVIPLARPHTWWSLGAKIFAPG
jgi:hypothetical protein